MFQSFTEKEGKCWSLSTFLKYKPFYITNPTEREKESCLCKRCLNAHLLLGGINIFHKTINLNPHLSVTMFTKQQHILFPGLLNDLEHYEIFEKYVVIYECSSEKEVCHYVFETKEESHIKNGERKTYTRTAKVDKKETVNEVVKTLLSQSNTYLRHHSHVDNIAKVFLLIKETFNSCYIELDFSQNLAMKPKFQPQDAHFSGKQFTFHCAIVEPEGPKYVCHLSDDTTHDSYFVHHVLTDIITTRNINNQTHIIKRDNAPTQYKNKYAFKSMQNLSDTYNLKIIRIFGAAGLIDAMSNFGSESILRRDIVAFDMWFANNKEICSYLTDKTDERMPYSVVDPVSVDASR